MVHVYRGRYVKFTRRSKRPGNGWQTFPGKATEHVSRRGTFPILSRRYAKAKELTTTLRTNDRSLLIRVCFETPAVDLERSRVLLQGKRLFSYTKNKIKLYCACYWHVWHASANGRARDDPRTTRGSFSDNKRPFFEIACCLWAALVCLFKRQTRALWEPLGYRTAKTLTYGRTAIRWKNWNWRQ